MSDIVERLRFRADENYEMLDNIHEPLLEAADEITRLRADVKQQIRERDHAREISIRYEADNTALRARVAELEEALRGLVDDEPCWLDHHGYCQAHSLGSPCEMANARAALKTEGEKP